MTQTSAALRLGDLRVGEKRRPRTNEIATRVSFTVETTVLPSFARQRFVNLGGSSSRMTQDSAAKRREDVDEVAARGLGCFCEEVFGRHSTPSAFDIWAMPTVALGSAKEAHRRWPEGRSEQGASKAKDGPPNGLQPQGGVTLKT